MDMLLSKGEEKSKKDLIQAGANCPVSGLSRILALSISCHLAMTPVLVPARA